MNAKLKTAALRAAAMLLAAATPAPPEGDYYRGGPGERAVLAACMGDGTASKPPSDLDYELAYKFWTTNGHPITSFDDLKEVDGANTLRWNSGGYDPVVEWIEATKKLIARNAQAEDSGANAARQLRVCLSVYLDRLNFLDAPSRAYDDERAAAARKKSNEAYAAKKAAEAEATKRADAAMPACDDDGVIDTVKSAIAASPAGVRLGLRVLEVRDAKSFSVSAASRSCGATAMTTAGRRHIVYRLSPDGDQYWVEVESLS